jgi:hypothetical protein
LTNISDDLSFVLEIDLVMIMSKYINFYF